MKRSIILLFTLAAGLILSGPQEEGHSECGMMVITIHDCQDSHCPLCEIRLPYESLPSTGRLSATNDLERPFYQICNKQKYSLNISLVAPLYEERGPYDQQGNSLILINCTLLI